MLMTALRNVANSILSSVRFSALRFSFQRPVSGNNNAAHALRLQAKPAITMYAQLLWRLSTGAVSERTPLLCCAIRFS